MLAKATLSATDLSQYTFSSSFSDVKSSYWGNRYINWAVETGVANGYEDNTFRPERAVTRQEMAVMVKNLAESTGKQFPNINSAMTFRDQGQIASWATEAVRLCQQASVISGDADTRMFRPTGRATGQRRPRRYQIPAKLQAWRLHHRAEARQRRGHKGLGLFPGRFQRRAGDGAKHGG